MLLSLSSLDIHWALFKESYEKNSWQSVALIYRAQLCSVKLGS